MGIYFALLPLEVPIVVDFWATAMCHQQLVKNTTGAVHRHASRRVIGIDIYEEEILESKAVANLSASWKDFFFFFSFFFFCPTVYAGVDSFVLVSTSPCEGLSG